MASDAPATLYEGSRIGPTEIQFDLAREHPGHISDLRGVIEHLFECRRGVMTHHYT